MTTAPAHQRRYSAFISYRHADNTQDGRRWAEWLHRALERYVVPPDLIGQPNLRGEPIRDSLYPIFRDEDELPANADLATGIRAALEVSDHLIVLCSPRSAVSPWVRKEVREFKELGRSDRILAMIIAGEPNADDPAKAREGVMRDEECFCEELRYGTARADGTIDWTQRTDPLAADLRPGRARAEGFVTAEAYREHLTLVSSLAPDKITALVEAYRQQLDHGLLKVIAGLLSVQMGQLADRDAAHRAELAKIELERAQAEAARLQSFSRRLALAGAAAAVLALLAGWLWSRTQAALAETNHQLELSHLEEGRAWLERARAAENNGDHLSALLLAARAVGFQAYGRKPIENDRFTTAFPMLLGKTMTDPATEIERQKEVNDLTQFIKTFQPTYLPLWASAMGDTTSFVAFSPDGTLLASDSDDKTIKLFDAATGTNLASLAGHMHWVTNAAFSPDSCRLASGSFDHTIKLWDIATAREIVTLAGHTNPVECVAFTPDGSRIASGSLDKSIKLWDVVTGRELFTFAGHTGPVTSVAFNPDGSRLACGSFDETVKILDAATGKEFASLTGHANQVSTVAFSPNGKFLASGSYDKLIKLWETGSGKELRSFAGHTDWVSSLAFSPDGSRLASSSFDKTIKLWDTETERELATLTGHTGPVSSVDFSPDGSRLTSSGSADETIKLWDIAKGKELNVLAGHTREVESVAFSPDGNRLATGSWDNTIKLWDASTGRELATLTGHEYGVTSVAFSLDGSQLVSRSNDKTIKLWNTATGKELNSLIGSEYGATSVFSLDGSRMACDSFDNTIYIWNSATGEKLASLVGHEHMVTMMSFSLDGSHLASCSTDHTIKLWDTATGRELTSLVGHQDTVESVAFSPDGNRFASGSSDKTIKLWDAASGKELATLVGHTKPVNRLAFSTDGRNLASSSPDKVIKLWDAITGNELILDAFALAIAKRWLATQDHRLSPDQQRIAECDGNRVFIVPANPQLDLTAPLRACLLAIPGRTLEFREIKGTTPMLHVRQDTLAQLANPNLTPEKRAELRMQLCTKSGQHRAATAQWQQLMRGEWPMGLGATGRVPRNAQTAAPAPPPTSIAPDSEIRRLYLLALIDATKRVNILGHATACETAAQIAPVLTQEMMTKPTLSLAMMSLMQQLTKDDSAEMAGPRSALMKRLNEVATKEWLEVLREGK